MCSWVAGELSSLAGRTMPFNPADIQQMAYNARDVDTRLRALASIVAELGWHVDADLDEAWVRIQAYDSLPARTIADEASSATSTRHPLANRHGRPSAQSRHKEN
jgi:hypothetical protein